MIVSKDAVIKYQANSFFTLLGGEFNADSLVQEAKLAAAEITGGLVVHANARMQSRWNKIYLSLRRHDLLTSILRGAPSIPLQIAHDLKYSRDIIEMIKECVSS